MDSKNVIIVGGGIAGLTAAIHLSRLGRTVTVIERHAYPRHKVCGEYLSNEVLPYLHSIGIEVRGLFPTAITRTQISTADGKTVDSKLPLGGFGVSRYAFDNLLYQQAIENGCTVIFETVSDITFSDENFSVALSDGKILNASVVLGAFGKRSNVDVKLNREFVGKKSPWLAVKAHYSGNFPADLVALHNFEGGYCGVSKVENDKINICYLADFDSFKKYKNIAEYEHQIVCGNPNLKRIFSESEMLFDKPLTISQISFSPKLPVENHILMIGDTAGLINPLCGNGMAIAIHSAKIASELVDQFISGSLSRGDLGHRFTQQWNLNFKNRMKFGRLLAETLQHRNLSNLVVNALTAFPSLLPKIIRQTHGEAILLSK